MFQKIASTQINRHLAYCVSESGYFHVTVRTVQVLRPELDAFILRNLHQNAAFNLNDNNSISQLTSQSNVENRIPINQNHCHSIQSVQLSNKMMSQILFRPKAKYFFRLDNNNVKD